MVITQQDRQSVVGQSEVVGGTAEPHGNGTRTATLNGSVPAALARDLRGQVLRLLHRSGPLTRAVIAARLGISTVTAGEFLTSLAASGLVVDAGKVQSSGGRPAQRVTLAPGGALVLGLDLSTWPVRAVVRDLAANVVFEAELQSPNEAEPVGDATSPRALGPSIAESFLPPSGVEDVTQFALEVLDRAGLQLKQIAAVGVAVVGFVNTETGMHRHTALPGAEAVPLAARVSQRLNVPVQIDDAARVAAVAETRDGAADEGSDVLFLNLGDRVGAAVILHGAVHRGAFGVVGELGHVVVRESGPRCSCGNVGCLQALISRPAILGQIRDALSDGVISIIEQRDTLSLAGVVDAAGRGDRLAISVLRQVGEDAGVALAAGVNLLGPAKVILGGFAPTLGKTFLDEVRRVLATHVVRPIWEHLEIAFGSLGVTAPSRGAALGALDLVIDSGMLLRAPLRRGRGPRATAQATVAGHLSRMVAEDAGNSER